MPCFSDRSEPSANRFDARSTSISSAVSTCPIHRMQCASRAGPRRTWPRRWPWPRPPRMAESGRRRFSMRISQWLWPPAMVSTSRTTSHPSAGRSTTKAVLRAWGGAASGSVLAMRIAKFAPRAPLMNHLCPLTTQWSPSLTAWVRISVGSEPATSGSVIAKHERWTPSHSGRRYCSFCSGVPKCSSVCMLPSSGAWQLRTNDPSDVRALSADTAAIAVGPSPIPPNSAGMCGSQRPHSLAFSRSWRMVTIRRRRPSGSCRSMVRSPSAGFTTVVMNSRTRWRTFSTSGGKVKSIMGDVLLYPRVPDQPVVRATLPTLVHEWSDAAVVDAPDAGDDVRGEGTRVRRSGVGASLLRGARTRDDDRDSLLVEHPAQRRPRGRRAPAGTCCNLARSTNADRERHAREGLADVEGLAIAVVGAVVVGRKGGRLVVAAREQPARQRHAGDDPDSRRPGRAQDGVERLLPEAVEDDLDRRNAGPLERSQGLGASLDAHAVGGDAPFRDQHVEGVEHRVARVHVARRTVQLHEVEDAAAQVRSTPIGPGAEAVERVRGAPVRLGAPAHLRGHREPGIGTLVAKSPDQALAATVAVDVGRVDEGDSRVDGSVQRRHGVGIGHRSPVGADLPGPQANDADPSARLSEYALLHRSDQPRGPLSSRTHRCQRDATRSAALAFVPRRSSTIE